MKTEVKGYHKQTEHLLVPVYGKKQAHDKAVQVAGNWSMQYISADGYATLNKDALRALGMSFEDSAELQDWLEVKRAQEKLLHEIEKHNAEEEFDFDLWDTNQEKFYFTFWPVGDGSVEILSTFDYIEKDERWYFGSEEAGKQIIIDLGADNVRTALGITDRIMEERYKDLEDRHI